MPIVVRTGKGTEELIPSQFASEDELETLIADNPSLVRMDGEPKAALVAQQITLPQAGILDVFLVDVQGKPIVVEAKLFRNGQSRREVLAQAIDYVSALALLTVDEVDRAVGGKLEEAMLSLSPDPDKVDEFLENCWQSCGTNLRAGAVTVVVAIDEAPEDLKRLMRYFSEHTDLDIRLISISKYVDSAGNVVLVPRAWVSGQEIEPVTQMGRRRQAKPMVPELQKAVEAYNVDAEDGLRAEKGGSDYRYIVPPGWPPAGDAHYEFIFRTTGVFVSIQLETDLVRGLGGFLQSLRPMLQKEFPNTTVDWDPNWSKGRGSLDIILPTDAEPPVVVQTMKKLIGLTHGQITAEWQKIQSQSSG